MTTGLRLMLFDDSCRGSKYPFGLTHSWIAGARLYQSFGQLDSTFGATSWDQGLSWLGSFDDPISEIQFWGHGKWGQMMIDSDRFDAESLSPNHSHSRYLDAIKDLLTDDAQIWIRTCETFGAEIGHDFAMRLTDRMQCAAAGHTYIIGPWQSGLHRLLPGETPTWDANEGIKQGTASDPQTALWSTPNEPNTVTCLTMTIPQKFL